METGMTNTSSTQVELKDVIRNYTNNWKWFILSVIVALVMAYLYIRYAVPEYEVKAKIQLLEEQGGSSELSVFQDLGIFSGSAKMVEDEIQLLNSRSNRIEAVKKLGLNIKITQLGNIKNSELYDDPPFKINFIASDSIVFNADYEFYIEPTSNSTFGFMELEDAPEKVFAFGQNIESPIGDIVLTPNMGNLAKFFGQKFHVAILPVSWVADVYQEKVIVTGGDQSNIVNLSLNDPIPSRGKNVLNALIAAYNRNAIEDKKTIADRTSNFINERIAYISSSLTEADQSAQEFKADRGITDIASEANINLNFGASTSQELQNANNQLNIAASMKDLVENQDGFEVLPSNIGLSDASIASTTARYNELALERKRLLKTANEKNPTIINLDQQLAGLKNNLQASLGSATNNLGLTVNSLSKQQSQINSRIYSVPKNERALRDITRQQQTTEGLYLYLLQKREESQIAYASATPKSKVIDNAYSSQLPVSPKIPLIYVASLLLGLMVPFTVIYTKDLLDNKVQNKIGLEKLVGDIPVLAELPKLEKKADALIIKDDRSAMAESLRILRTNLDYLIKTKHGPSKNNIIFITSSVPGEGKTFLSSNLAMIFASTNKKVLLIGADIRNPKLYNFTLGKNVDELGSKRGKKEVGLTEYLYDESLTSKDLIHSMLIYSNTIDIIYSGKIPPNPAELLMGDRVKPLFEEVSELYDYVIVDTAPMMVVTDTLLISEYADHIIYVTRAGMTEKKVLEFPIKLRKEGKLKGLSFVVNGVKSTHLGYGGKYGYGYGKSVKKWWKF
jgi:capsular exopolysaccharide synthesis family protein